MFPGRNSVWILDGARIHCHPSIVRYFQSLGIFLIFLPPYTPFFNPIEVIFGLMNKHLKRKHAGSSKDMEILINEELTKMGWYNCTNIFKSCGYTMSGRFDPSVAFEESAETFGFDVVPEKGTGPVEN